MFVPPRNKTASPASGARIGSATLVGAGPGEPDLLTLRAVKAIQRADAVLFDALIDPAILDLARPDVRRIDVGKRCGRHAMNQAAINALIVSLAQSGAHVVRLKGGDPLVFGRGGEELDSLRAAGVPVEVVPGVTAACAAAASLQIPLTHRDSARSLHFVTGHGSDGEVPAHDWRALVASGGTIAAYMAGKTLRRVAESLLTAGLPPSTPAVAVENASRANETHVHATVGTLADRLEAHNPVGPTMVLIGSVVALSRQLRGTVSLAA
jgi:uroporphyrin-III C-methyltransferase / precorrin-2 dehydrogenase / sirohydrochlorin ferrochelatase